MHTLLSLTPLITLYLTQVKPSLFCYPLLATLAVEILLFVSLFCSRDTLPILATILILYTTAGRAVAIATPAFGFEVARLAMIEGVLVEDSAVSRSDACLLKLNLTGAGTEEGDTCTANGVVSVIVPSEGMLTASTEAIITGHFSEDLFIGTSLQVIRVGRTAYLRDLLLQRLHRRLKTSIQDPDTRALSTALLLGQSDQEGFLLKDLFLACGTAHVLALSGMHLSFFFSASLLFFSLICTGRTRQVVAMLPPLGYVTLVGPKPSLIRATLFRLALLFSIEPVEAVVLSFVIQMLLSPSIIFSWAALFSWSAFSILVLSSELPRFPLSTTAFAVAATAPGSMMLSGYWNPAGLLFSFPLTVLIALAMLLGLLTLLIGPPVAPLLILLTSLIQRLLLWGAVRPILLGVDGYVIYLFVLLTTVAAIGYAEHAVKMRRRRFYELGVRIRLTQGDWCATDTAGVRHDQEVWTKLSHLDPDEKADCQSAGGEGRGPGC